MLEIQRRLSPLFYFLLSLPATAMGFALCVQIAALSWIMHTKYGLNIHQVGIVWLGGPLAGMIGQVLFGIISDRAWFWGGRRRPFILIGGTLAALMLLSLPFLDVFAGILGLRDILPLAIFVALTLDLAINISFNPTRSLIADVTPEGEHRTRGFTWMQTVSGFFGVLAYFIGAELGNYTLIYLGAVLVILFSIVPALLIEEPHQLSENRKSNVTSNPEVDKHQSANRWKLYLAHGFTWLGVQTMFVYIFFFIKYMLFGQNAGELTGEQNDDIGKLIGYSFLFLNTVGFIFPRLVLEPVALKIGRVTTHACSIAIMAVAYLFMFFLARDAISLYVLMALAGIGWAATVSLPFAIYSDMVNPAKMGFYMGIFNLSVVIPQLFVSLLVGKLIMHMPNPAWMFVFCSICLFVSAVLWLMVRDTRLHFTEA